MRFCWSRLKLSAEGFEVSSTNVRPEGIVSLITRSKASELLEPVWVTLIVYLTTEPTVTLVDGSAVFSIERSGSTTVTFASSPSSKTVPFSSSWRDLTRFTRTFPSWFSMTFSTMVLRLISMILLPVKLPRSQVTTLPVTSKVPHPSPLVSLTH